MLFNSIEFIFMFLPITLIVYFLLNKMGLVVGARSWLIIASLFFYGWANLSYLPLLLGSIIFNYLISSMITSDKVFLNRKATLTVGILSNVFFLGYFKYYDFFISSFNSILSTDFNLLRLVLPLAISFFTFQQIAYLVDSYRNSSVKYNLLDYMQFVTFFPHLIAGPIVNHKDTLPQLISVENKVVNYKNLSLGFYIFLIGLFKKIAIAGTFSSWATTGFDTAPILTFIEAWVTSLAYTFQLYFDFSGYTDMAIGSALMFNIKLPINFNSPYKSLNIQDFWRRWHITLGKFLTNYIYIPLGGNKNGPCKTYLNIIIVFLISGLWHGAGLPFIFWGFLHGFATVLNRAWQKLNISLPSVIAWLITFNFVNIAWVFFRAKEWSDAMKVLKGMAGLNGVVVPHLIESKVGFLTNLGIKFGNILENIDGSEKAIVFTIIFGLVTFFSKNSTEMLNDFKPNWKYSVFIVSIVVITMYLSFSLQTNSEFLYFNF